MSITGAQMIRPVGGVRVTVHTAADGTISATPEDDGDSFVVDASSDDGTRNVRRYDSPKVIAQIVPRAEGGVLMVPVHRDRETGLFIGFGKREIHTSAEVALAYIAGV